MPKFAWSLACCTAFAFSVQPGIAAAASSPELPRIVALRDEGRWADALALIQSALQASPDDRELFRLEVLTLSDAGEHERAHALYLTRADLFTGGEKLILDARWFARRISAALASDFDDVARRAGVERLLDEVDRYVADVRASGRDVPPSLLFDRLLLVGDLQRHGDVTAQYERWARDGVDVPAYALTVVADSYMALRQTERAEPVIRAALAKEPGNEGLQAQLGYALIEQEKVEEGIAHLRERMRATAAADDGSPARHRARVNAESSYAFAQGFSENTPEALAHLEALAAASPDDAGVQTLLGTVHRYRGASGRALEHYRAAERLDPRSVDARLGQIAALDDLQRPDLAGPILDRLVAEHPYSTRVLRARNDREAARASNGSVFAAQGRSDSETSPVGSHDARYGMRVASPLLADRWRLLARAETRTAQFRGQDIRDTRAAVGVGYAFDRLNADAFVERAQDGIGGTAASLWLRWRASDHLSLRASASRNDAGASLQARAAGIAADALRLSADYRWSDWTSAALGLERWRYDDGNVRDILTGSFSQRVVSRPHLIADAIAYAYTSRSSERDVPYFNPSRDASGELTLRATHVTWRRYERSFRQRLSLTLGDYWQEGFGAAFVPSARYEHIWQIDAGHVLQYGLSWARPVYDGQRERRLGLDLEYRWGR